MNVKSISMSWHDDGSVQWRHNERDGVLNRQPHDCSLNRLFRRRSKKTSKLHVTGLVRGIHRSPVNSPHKGPVTWKTFPFDDVIMYCTFFTETEILDVQEPLMEDCCTVYCDGYSEEKVQVDILVNSPLDKMASVSQTVFSDAFLWMKSFVFRLKFHWSLFLRVQLTITHHWFR